MARSDNLWRLSSTLCNGKPDEPKLLTNVLTNPEKPNEINAADLFCDRAGSRATARTANNSAGGFGSSLGPGAGEGLAGGTPLRPCAGTLSTRSNNATGEDSRSCRD